MRLRDYACLSCLPFGLVAAIAAGVKKYYLINNPTFSSIPYKMHANLFDRLFNETDLSALAYGIEAGLIVFGACMLVAGLYEMKKRRTTHI